MEDKEIEQLADKYFADKKPKIDSPHEAYIDGFKKAQELLDDKWISVDILPKIDGYYLVFHKEGNSEFTSRVYYSKLNEYHWSDYWWSATHWQPLPSPPQLKDK